MGETKVIGLCSANVQRSGTFEAVMKYELYLRRKSHSVVISSAGINVESILAKVVETENMLNILYSSLLLGVARESTKKAIRPILTEEIDPKDIDKISEINRLYEEVLPLVQGAGIAYRNQALSEVGIPNGFYPRPMTPLNQESNPQLLLPVTDSLAKIVRERYHNEEEGVETRVKLLTPDRLNQRVLERDEVVVKVPKIMTYGQLVGVEDLADNPGGGMCNARKQVKYFMDTRKTAVDRIIELTNV